MIDTYPLKWVISKKLKQLEINIDKINLNLYMSFK